MKNNQFFFLIFLLFVIADGNEPKPWERLGLSQTEWKLIKDKNIPMVKVEKLLKYGIGISEYFQKPWEQLGLSESKWAAKRRSGMSNYDIELEAKSKDQHWKNDVEDGFKAEFRGVSESGETFSSLLLPGYQQFKAQRKVHGTIMVSLAGGALLWCTAGSIRNQRFEVIPLVGILVPDMVWSFIDYKIFKKRNSQ